MQQRRLSLEQDKTKDYYELLKQFTAYREHSLAEKEHMKKQIQKTKQQLQKFMSKLDKRVDSRIAEEKRLHNHHQEEQEQYYKTEIQKLRTLLIQKDRLVEEIRTLLRMVENQKRQMLESSTAMLIELSQGLDPKQNALNNSKDSSNKQLLKMYQFLIEENNDLKKQIYLLKKSNIHSSAVAPKQEKSLLSSISELKPKSPTTYSAKNENTNSFKNSSFRNDAGKQKTEKTDKTDKTEKTKKSGKGKTNNR